MLKKKRKNLRYPGDYICLNSIQQLEYQTYPRKDRRWLVGGPREHRMDRMDGGEQQKGGPSTAAGNHTLGKYEEI